MESINMSLLDEKEKFARQLSDFAASLPSVIAQKDEWTVRGFIDIFQNIYSVSPDTKIISKILELHIFPHFLSFAQKIGYRLELAAYQNWYPDLSFISKDNPQTMFAVDLKTTYRDEEHPGFCNGFTLGSHGEYFINRTSSKNIQYPYDRYAGHFCLGIIYSRREMDKNEETRIYSLKTLRDIPAVIRNFTCFAQEKWKIASDKGGSGNTANIGSIQKISDILSGNGVFAKAGEQLFDDYWANFGKMEIPDGRGNYKKLSSFRDYLQYRGLSKELYNPKAPKRKGETKE